MRKSKRTRSFPVAAIGASAGGLKAFEDLLKALPKKPGMAFVLVPHLAPQYKSHLTEILARCTTLPLCEVKSGDKVQADHIFVLPPNRDLRIRNGVLRLSTVSPKAARRNPIDGFFRSLALDQGPHAVGVLLSGAGSDGTAGLQAIKDAGGTTFAQDPKTAAHISMPHSAAMAGCVDHILSPGGIGRKLGSPGGVGALRREARRPEGDVFPDRILAYLGSMKGIEFELYKKSTLKRRIQRRMVLRRIRNPEKYLAVLKDDPAELDALYLSALISVTSFFREPESFKALKSVIYPRLFKNRSFRAPIRIWVPGCSTGQEAYSHAINLVETLGPKAPLTPFQIFATDVNPLVIESARAGLYPKKIRSEVSAERLKRFFIETPDGYRISPAIRERCIFATKNLVQDPPFINLDLISCRNLLIYFGPSLQERALQVFQYALRPRGILMLGRSEAVGDFSGRFTPLSVKRKVFSERTSASKTQLDFVQPGSFLETQPTFLGAGQAYELTKPLPEHADLQAELESVLPARYLPNGVIVNGDLEILRFVGDSSPFLRPAAGKPSLNMRGMAPRELLLDLRAAVHMARKSGEAVVKNIGAPDRDGSARRTRIEVLPVKSSERLKGCFLILFEPLEIAADSKPARGTRNGKESRRVTELKEDLAVSAEHLKVIIDEQEMTNARLKGSNEELLSSNEELQSVNEEF